jgi:hypothetical protein
MDRRQLLFGANLCDSPQNYIFQSATGPYAIRRSGGSFVTVSFAFAWG